MSVYSFTPPNTNCATPGCWCRDRVARYPSDLTDAQWEVLRPQAEEVMNELRQAAGRPMVHDLRAILDAVFYVVGPPAMTVAVRDTLMNVGVDDACVRVEEFAGY